MNCDELIPGISISQFPINWSLVFCLLFFVSHNVVALMARQDEILLPKGANVPELVYICHKTCEECMRTMLPNWCPHSKYNTAEANTTRECNICAPNKTNKQVIKSLLINYVIIIIILTIINLNVTKHRYRFNVLSHSRNPNHLHTVLRET